MPVDYRSRSELASAPPLRIIPPSIIKVSQREERQDSYFIRDLEIGFWWACDVPAACFPTPPLCVCVDHASAFTHVSLTHSGLMGFLLTPSCRNNSSQPGSPRAVNLCALFSICRGLLCKYLGFQAPSNNHCGPLLSSPFTSRCRCPVR